MSGDEQCEINLHKLVHGLTQKDPLSQCMGQMGHLKHQSPDTTVEQYIITHILIVEGRDWHEMLEAVQPSLNFPPHSITSEQTVLPVITIHVRDTVTSNYNKETLTFSMWFTSTLASTNSLTISIFFFLVATNRGVWPLCGKCNNTLQKMCFAFFGIPNWEHLG